MIMAGAAAIETGLVLGRPRLAYDICGTGPLLVFLHGIGGGRVNWRRQLAQFGEHFTAVAWDARGYGDSDDYDGPLAFTDFADDLARLLDHLDAPRAHVVGLSMGGRIALDLWRRFPDRVASLTLADTSAGSREAQDPTKIAAFLAARQKPLLDGMTPAELAPQLVEALLGPAASGAVRAELTASLAALHRDSYLKTLEAVTRFTDFPDFAAIAVPVLVVAGTADRIAPPDVVAAMAAAIPGATLIMIEAAGHVSNVEAPAAFNAALAGFLAGIGA